MSFNEFDRVQLSMIEDVDHWFELLEEVKARLEREMRIFLG